MESFFSGFFSSLIIGQIPVANEHRLYLQHNLQKTQRFTKVGQSTNNKTPISRPSETDHTVLLVCRVRSVMTQCLPGQVVCRLRHIRIGLPHHPNRNPLSSGMIPLPAPAHFRVLLIEPLATLHLDLSPVGELYKCLLHQTRQESERLQVDVEMILWSISY